MRSGDEDDAVDSLQHRGAGAGRSRLAGHGVKMPVQPKPEALAEIDR
jgi:hypothetical protein